MKRKTKEDVFALCLENKDADDLEQRKVYQVIQDEKASKDGYLRIIDESGEDYLYPKSYFLIIPLPRETQQLLRIAS